MENKDPETNPVNEFNTQPPEGPFFQQPITHQFDTNEPEKDELNFAEIFPAPSPRRRRMGLNLKSRLSGLKPNLHRPSRGSFSFKKKPLIITTAVFVLLLIVGGFFLSQSSQKTAAKSDKKAEIPDAKSRQVINKLVDFPIKDSAGKEVTRIHYSLENAELHDQIVVQGQRATAVQGKVFLVINLKLTNDYDKPIQINTKDYIRLTRNGSDEQLAADIHNDPVTVQPISTKYTRLGFALNDNDKNLQLHIGEINGDKTTIDVKF